MGLSGVGVGPARVGVLLGVAIALGMSLPNARGNGSTIVQVPFSDGGGLGVWITGHSEHDLIPRYVRVDSQGHLLLSDELNGRILVFFPSGALRTVLTTAAGGRYGPPGFALLGGEKLALAAGGEVRIVDYSGTLLASRPGLEGAVLTGRDRESFYVFHGAGSWARVSASGAVLDSGSAAPELLGVSRSMGRIDELEVRRIEAGSECWAFLSVSSSAHHFISADGTAYVVVQTDRAVPPPTSEGIVTEPFGWTVFRLAAGGEPTGKFDLPPSRHIPPDPSSTSDGGAIVVEEVDEPFEGFNGSWYYTAYDQTALTVFRHDGGWQPVSSQDAIRRLENSPPVIEPQPPRSVRVGEELIIPLSVSDPDAAMGRDLLQVRAEQLPPSAVFDGDLRVLWWVPRAGEVGAHIVRVIAEDEFCHQVFVDLEIAVLSP